MTASPALLTKELESAMAKLRLIAREGGGMCFALMDAEATAVMQHIAALEQLVADLRNRLNLSEKLQGRFPVDAVQPDPKAEAVRQAVEWLARNAIVSLNDWDPICNKLLRAADQLAEQETLLAERNRECDRLRDLLQEARDVISDGLESDGDYEPGWSRLDRDLVARIDARLAGAAMGAREGM